MFLECAVIELVYRPMRSLLQVFEKVSGSLKYDSKKKILPTNIWTPTPITIPHSCMVIILHVYVQARVM